MVVLIPLFNIYDAADAHSSSSSFNQTQRSSPEVIQSLDSDKDKVIVFVMFAVPAAAALNASFVYFFFYRHIRFTFFRLEQCQIENMLFSATTREMLAENGPAASAFLVPHQPPGDNSNTKSIAPAATSHEDESADPLGDTRKSVKLGHVTTFPHKSAPASPLSRASSSPQKRTTIISSASNALVEPVYQDGSMSSGLATTSASSPNNDDPLKRTASLFSVGSFAASENSPFGHSRDTPKAARERAEVFHPSDAITTPLSPDDGKDKGQPTANGSPPKKLASCLKNRSGGNIPGGKSPLTQNDGTVLEKLLAVNVGPLNLHGDVEGGGGHNSDPSVDVSTGKTTVSKSNRGIGLHRSATFYMKGRSDGRRQPKSATKIVHNVPLDAAIDSVFVRWSAADPTGDAVLRKNSAAGEEKSCRGREVAHLLLLPPAHPVEVEGFRRMSLITQNLERKSRPYIYCTSDAVRFSAADDALLKPTSPSQSPLGTATSNTDAPRQKAPHSHVFCCECFGSDDDPADEDEDVIRRKEGDYGVVGRCLRKLCSNGWQPGIPWAVLDPQLVRMLDESELTIRRCVYLRQRIASQLNTLFEITSLSERAAAVGTTEQQLSNNGSFAGPRQAVRRHSSSTRLPRRTVRQDSGSPFTFTATGSTPF